MKAVILAGGMGTRIREETEFRPKPMVEIGGKPILWHLMKLLAEQGVKDFVICAGYKGEQIKSYFLNYGALNSDFTIRLDRGTELITHGSHLESDWTVTIADTGAETGTAARIERIEPYVRGERFIATYGDGLADVSIPALLAVHEARGLHATVTAVRPLTRFGIIETDEDGLVSHFREKPQSEDWVNAGFFVFEPAVFDYLHGDDQMMLEREPLAALAADHQLGVHRHDGFWQPMDTYRESQMLNELWARNQAPWKLWA